MHKRLFRAAPLVLMVFVLSVFLSVSVMAAGTDCTVNAVKQAGTTPFKVTVNGKSANWILNWYLGKLNISNPAPATELTPAPEPTPVPAPTPESAPAPTSTPASTSESKSVQGLTADEQKMVDLVNAERTSRGLKPLTVDMRLVETARAKSQDMIDKNYFSHTSPTYGSPFDMMKNAGITYRTAGENLAGNSTVDAAHTALMNSSGHRANILNANFTHIGIGVVDGGPYGKMFTQHFIGL